MFESPELMAPPAHVVEAESAFEQRMAIEWKNACADEVDAVTRKQMVLREALKRWPMVPRMMPTGGLGRLMHSPKMRQFVRDVLGMPDHKKGGMNGRANTLLREGGREKNIQQNAVKHSRNSKIKTAAIELATKYRLGADPRECMESLAKMIEETQNVQA